MYMLIQLFFNIHVHAVQKPVRDSHFKDWPTDHLTQLASLIKHQYVENNYENISDHRM